MCHLCGFWLAKWNDVILLADMLSHHARVKVTKSSLNMIFIFFFNSKLIVEYFSNKSVFDDKLKVSCPAGMDNYLICMHCFETNTCAFFFFFFFFFGDVWNFTGAWCDNVREQYDIIYRFRSIMQRVNFVVLRRFIYNICHKNVVCF